MTPDNTELREEELQDTCVEIQKLTHLTDEAWEREFFNKQGLYGLIKSREQAAYKQGWEAAMSQENVPERQLEGEQR